LSFWDHLRRIARALTPPPPTSARAEAQRRLNELQEEMWRYDAVIGVATDAAIALAPDGMPHIRDRDMGASIGLEHCHCTYVFETDADLAFARERQWTDWLDRTTREQLARNGTPKHLVDKFRVSFTTHEDIVRKTGGDYRMYFS
jgi:predicted NAD/FAD-binding protein